MLVHTYIKVSCHKEEYLSIKVCKNEKKNRLKPLSRHESFFIFHFFCAPVIFFKLIYPLGRSLKNMESVFPFPHAGNRWAKHTNARKKKLIADVFPFRRLLWEYIIGKMGNHFWRDTQAEMSDLIFQAACMRFVNRKRVYFFYLGFFNINSWLEIESVLWRALFFLDIQVKG